MKQLSDAITDFIKDDELMGNSPQSPLRRACGGSDEGDQDHAQWTGKRVLFAFNLTDNYDNMQRHYDKVISLGGVAAMISVNTVGLPTAIKVCGRGELVIHGHRNGWGQLNRDEWLGMGFEAYGKLWRLAGVDQIHVNGIDNKFWEADDDVVASIATCREPLHGLRPIMPVLSSGQWGGQAFETWRRTQTTDLLYLAGGGIVAHPDGIAGGVAALLQAWACAEEGMTLEAAAERHDELRHAVDKFGGKKS